MTKTIIGGGTAGFDKEFGGIGEETSGIDSKPGSIKEI